MDVNRISAKEIAKITDKHVVSIHRRADIENWPYKESHVRGGIQHLYIIDALPDDIRTAVLAHRAERSPAVCIGSDMKLRPDQRDNAMAKADLLRIYTDHLRWAAWGEKGTARTMFMRAYNSGIAYPALYEKLGDLSWKTLEEWKRTVKTCGDTLSLADRRGYWRRGKNELTDEQTDILLRCALHPNRPLIAEAIRMAVSIMHAKGIPNGRSASTYRRWLEDWKSKHIHIWTFSREGAKAWNDNCAFYIERDYTPINVGAILVADGHVLNFEIVNPWTGKPKRMTLIVWHDMKSNFPLGWEIMPTENTKAIASALRRAILRLGKYPQVAYLDNGKAFASRFFQGADLEQAGFSGLFERLGIRTIFAWPYHAQSKTVERFFGSFAELERWCPTYTGTSIDKKPPRMMRGEKLHRSAYQKMTRGDCITLEQAHRAVAAWFDAYVQRPQDGHLEGRTPIEVFLGGKGAGVDAAELRYMMLSQEIRTINRNGVYFLGKNYYAPELYGRRHPVEIRYDFQNMDSVLVFDRDGTFLCEAPQTEKAHPAASILGTEEDRERLTRLIAHKKWQEREASASAREFLEQEVIPEARAHMERIGLAPDGTEGKTDRGKEGQSKQISLDEKKILAEVAALERGREDEADRFFAELSSTPEMDRYEKLVEAEVRGWMIPKQWQAFMRYYEQTPEYARHAEFWEEHRVKTAYMHQIM